MPPVKLIVYCTAEGTASFVHWMKNLQPKARAKCRVRLELLAAEGSGLRRPFAEYLGDGIHELRFKNSGVNFRVLYFFHGREAVIISHGFTKQKARVPRKEIALALKNRQDFVTDPARHTLG